MRDGWTESTLGDVAEWFSGGTPKAGKPEFYENGTIPWVVIADMMKTEIFDTASKITKAGLAEIGGRVAPKGSVLISMYATVGRPGFAHIPVATNQAIAWSVPNEKMILPRFLLLVAQFLESEISSMARGATQRNINRAMLKEFRFKLPPLDEQKRIVDVVSSVDAYIDALQQQSHSARTARSAVLHQLLSTGGDDWTETTLGEVAIWGSGGTPKSGESAYYGGDIPWCVIGDLTEDEVFLTEKCITSDGLKNSSAKIVEPGAVLIAMYGASIGRTGMVGRPMATNQAIAFAYPTIGTLDNRFLLLFLQTQKLQFVEAGQGAAQPNISQTVLKAWPIILPPLDEQKRIVEIVSAMDDVIQSTEQAVLDAKNLRSGLLSDLLSGEHEIPASYDSFLGAA